MIHLKFSGGAYNFKEFALATTSANSYYPILNFDNMTPLQEGIMLYNQFKRDQYNYAKGYDALFQKLEFSRSLVSYSFTSQALDYQILVAKGYISDIDDNILLCLTINTLDEELLNNEVIGKPEYSRYKLFIANKFIVDPIYANIWKNVNQRFVSLAYDNDVPVEITTPEEIKRQVYSNDFVIKYKSITELQNHLKNDVDDLLLIDFEYREVEPEQVNLPNLEVEDEPELTVSSGEPFTITMDNSSTSGVFSGNIGSILTTSDNSGIIWTNSEDSSETRYTIGNDPYISPVAVPDGNITEYDEIPQIDDYQDEEEEEDYTDEQESALAEADLEEELSMEEYLDNAAEEQEPYIAEDEPDVNYEEVIMPNFMYESVTSSGILSETDINMFARVLFNEHNAIVRAMLYDEENNIVAVYVGGHTQIFTEEQVLDMISTEEESVQIGEPVVFNSDLVPIMMTSDAGFTWEHYNYGDSLVDINTLSQFVTNRYYFGRTVHSLTQRTDNMIEVLYLDNTNEILTETEVFNEALPVAVTAISNDINLIDDTE
jgi:hypothetical protein